VVEAAAFGQGKEADGFPDATQGDVKGAQIQSGIEQAVQAVIQEGEFFQERRLISLLLPAALEFALPEEMLIMTTEGRGAGTVLLGQAAVRDPGEQIAIDLRT
jgi:hypothetical protein